MITATIPESVVEKIKKLLSLAEHEGSNENEASIALEKAQKILLEYNLTRADIKINDDYKTPAGIGKIDGIETAGYTWKKSLLNTIALNMLCHVVVTPSENKWHLFGTYDNVKSTLEVYHWVAAQLESAALNQWSKYHKNGGYEPVRTWKAGFFSGAINAISNRLRKPMADFSAGNGRALVIQNKAMLDNAVSKIFPRLGHSYSKMSGGSDGAAGGRMAGNNVTLTPQHKLSGKILALPF